MKEPLPGNRAAARGSRLAPSCALRAILCAVLCVPAVAKAAPASAWYQPPVSSSGSQATVVLSDSVDALVRGLDAEDEGKLQRAADAYREVIETGLAQPQPDGDRIVMALLGYERVMVGLGLPDSVVPIIDKVIQRRPTDPVARTVQLRTLSTLYRDDELRAAFLAWRRAAPDNAAPYREYARIMLQRGRTLVADTILNEAARVMRRDADLAGETAQLNVSMGRWEAAAKSYRGALATQPWLETAGLMGLQRAPGEARDSIRNVLAAEPVNMPARRMLAGLEWAWGEPRRAWSALAALKANDDSTRAAWTDFANQAEASSAWSVARDAWLALFNADSQLETQYRAADAALSAGDAADALRIVNQKSSGPDSLRKQLLTPVRLAALAEAGDVDEARRLFETLDKGLDPLARSGLLRPLVTGLLRVGNLERAGEMIRDSDLEYDDELMGWMALYKGDLAAARRHLVRAASRRTELVDALGVLARIRLNSSATLGSAYLALARHDSASAIRHFVSFADSVGSAAPALLAQAARLSAPAAATQLRNRIVSDYPSSPEAPGALLDWARSLKSAGENDQAVEKLEQLLINYTDSALAPQARRELEIIKGQVPP